MATTPTTCTIQKASGLCGEPAVTTFIARDGQVYAECAAHSPSGRRIIAEVKAPVAHIILRTRSLADYALVAHGAIVGYAYSASPAVCQRAARLRARLLPIENGKVVV